ncbi:hypothetical protein ACV3R1_13435 [Clostridium perfringens]|uniref:hypothetical protein n=1 Tax=Clostridium perfringens TaxID=1502 RepID=UPI001A29483A|nr:hypothetical protein [Clostridium perfringens]HAT4111134.1 hypothetical protein [Clostridium perfringens]
MENSKDEEQLECFVIMPISNHKDYNDGHFNFVYEDIFKPAIQNAGFKPYRVDESKGCNVIHLEIIKKLIESPMAICDVSTRNPNVLYELGIRQAFDKPVILVGDDDPSKIFDIANINTYKYNRTLNYRSVLQDQEEISKRIKETFENHKNGIDSNSLIKILKIDAATKEVNPKEKLNEKDMITMMYNELIALKKDLRKEVNLNKSNNLNSILSYDMLKSRYDDIIEWFNYFGKFDDINIIEELIDQLIFYSNSKHISKNTKYDLLKKVDSLREIIGKVKERNIEK